MKTLRSLPLVMASSTLLLFASLCLTPASGLLCWKNLDTPADTKWKIETCNMTNNEVSCLAQYRLYNGEISHSYFGCHTTNTPCNATCNVTECTSNAFSCCCSSDLCNKAENLTLEASTAESLPHQTPAPQEGGTPTETPPAEATGRCQDAGCTHKCIEDMGIPHCYCNWGHILDEDGRTCVDLDECAYNNGGCEDVCHNEIGTGFHCSCRTTQILAKDGYSCEDFSSLVCYHESCVGDHCLPKKNNDETEREVCTGSGNTPQHCQATFTKNGNGELEIRLRSCFSGDFSCEQGGCTPTLIENTPGYYYCCCDGDLCNGNIRNVTNT